MSQPPSSQTTTPTGSQCSSSAATSRRSPSPAPPTDSEANRRSVRASIDEEAWFHGFCTHSYADERLQQVGDWLVRATEARHKTELLISTRGAERRVVHLSLAYDRPTDRWHLGIVRSKRPNFASILDLLRHYHRHRLPGVRTPLKNAVLRPKWNVQPENIRYDKKKDFLGAGNFATVYRGQLIQGDKRVEVAVKVCHELAAEDATASKAKKSMFREGLVMSSYQHANIIQLYGMVLNRPPVVIVLELCPGGALLAHLQRERAAIGRGERVLYAFEAAKGMNYLHRHHCVHRDLAARNVLIGADGRLKIADFGLSQVSGLVERMWQLNADERPPFKELLPAFFRLHAAVYPPPPPAELTLSRLKGVRRVPYDQQLEPEFAVDALDLMSAPPASNDCWTREDAGSPDQAAAAAPSPRTPRARTPGTRTAESSTVVRRRGASTR
ncbi:SH2 motif and Tyrosine protein kinase domain containing protein [Aphelenchoides fujianensis]|nr:SH2 motif and Tyrosine protein kinase domain containing protein [Aphelenchoides fujianensis]